MKKLLLLAFCCILLAKTQAQTTPIPPPMMTVRGTVIDSAVNQPLGYVTVVLQDAQSKKSVKAGLAKDNGTFELTAAAGKTYQLSLAFVGYQNKVVNITATGNSIDVGKVLLSPSNKQLKEVSVVAVRPLMKQEVDRISYDVQADPESKALTALDMIRKVPLLSVDANNDIKLKGSGNYKILVNGKESALFAKTPSDVLDAMPATNIERIEVITTPPAKYDAEGLAGIINIITKTNADQGYNANVSGRYNSVFGPGINLRANAKQGKLGLTMFVGVNRNNGFNADFGNSQTVFNGGPTTEQDGTGHNTFHNGYGNAELSYEIDTLNLLTGSFQMFRGNGVQNNYQLSNIFNNDGSVAQQYNRLSLGNNTFQGMDASVNYQIGFKKSKEQLLTFSYKYSYSPFSQYTDNTFSNRVNYFQSMQPDFTQNNSSGSKEHTIQVDYAQPFKALTLEAGGKAILRNNYSDFDRSDRDSSTNQYNLNPLYTDNFIYHQDVYSLYNSYQLKFDKWTAKAGLRLEHTTINADFTSVSTTVHQSYSNLIPSISIQRSFKSSSVNFGFTQRIQRPGIYQLNPFINNSDPQFVNTGNPNLRPELNNTFELTYSNFAKNSLNVGLNYAFSNNSIQNVTSYNPKDSVTTTTYQNLGSNRTLGLDINTNFAITKQFTVSLNGQVQEVWLTGTYNGQLYKNSGFTGNAFANAGYRFNGGYRFGIDAGFFSGDVTLQGKSNAFIYNSYVLTKEFLNKKATISLVANNPEVKFHEFRSSTTTPDFYQSSFNQNPYRTFAVRFSYKFGKLNTEIKKNQHGINNDDTKGGGGGGGNSGGGK